ncbi:peptidylprolyl isomerase [Rhodoblastus sp.]|jgi:hypothetical protein|uniref:peptidylprolyl isomerase n=1 Tax=Rhodoblastus sp. TaxID=1962975 RepID=UPI0025D31ED8|nr:peptidylprolyl isomerase [Rhodoblastus sp.]
MLKKLFEEPLLHFIILAFAIFGLYAVVNRSPAGGGDDRIVITGAKVEQLANLFGNTWQRPPTAIELKGLVENYIKEEIYNREAVMLGLDKNDTSIRRRLRQKYEFLIDADAEGQAPTDAQLQAYLQAHADRFEIGPKLAFQQIYLSPASRGDRIEQDAATLLETLRKDPAETPRGDATLLPSEVAMTRLTAIGEMFGDDFATALKNKAEARLWTGPIRSAFGLHLVRILDRQPVRLPALDEVRAAVARDWSNETRKSVEDARYRQLLARYHIVVETQPETSR